MRHPKDAESSIVISGSYLGGGVIAAVPLLAVPQNWSLLGTVTIYLTAVVTLGLALAIRLAPAAAASWLIGEHWPDRRKRAFAAVVLIGLVTFVVGLVTLATGAALRLDPSLQFLQMISALDIAWVVTAIVLGLWIRLGPGVAFAGGVATTAECVGALWNYLRVVGFGPAGEWVLDSAELMRLVLPADMVAAIVASAVLLWGLAGVGQPIEQARDQS